MNAVYNEGCSRASVREVYDFIIKDLDQALQLLQQSEMKRTNKQFASPEVVYGLRARIYMVMNRWEEAAANAQRVIEAGIAAPYTKDEVSRPTFADINHNAWIWGIDTQEEDPVVTSGIINWPSHMGTFSYGYAQVGTWRKVSKSLYNAIPSTDVRKGWFLSQDCTSANLNEEQANYIANEKRNSPKPSIICGDFNDVPYSYVYNTMLGDMIDGFKECGSGWMYTFRGRKAVRIDYIFHDKSLKGLSYYKSDITNSDHLPVFMKIAL
jgi:hypothetical protein